MRQFVAEPRRMARPSSPVSGKFRRLFPSAVSIYPVIAESTVSGSETSRHYLAGVPQNTLPVILNQAITGSHNTGASLWQEWRLVLEP